MNNNTDISARIEEQFNLFYEEMVLRVPSIESIDRKVLRAFFTQGGTAASVIVADVLKGIGNE